MYGLASAVLGKQVAVKKYGNANYNKTWIVGKVIRAYDGRKEGGKQAQWKVEARWNIPGHAEGQVYTIRRQDVHLEQPRANPITVIANFPDSIDHRDHPTKGSSTYLASASSDLTTESSATTAASDAGVGAPAGTAGLKRPHELLSVGARGSNDNVSVGVGGRAAADGSTAQQPPIHQSHQPMAAVGTGATGGLTTANNKVSVCISCVMYSIYHVSCTHIMCYHVYLQQLPKCLHLLFSLPCQELVHLLQDLLPPGSDRREAQHHVLQRHRPPRYLLLVHLRPHRPRQQQVLISMPIHSLCRGRMECTVWCPSIMVESG